MSATRFVAIIILALLLFVIGRIGFDFYQKHQAQSIQDSATPGLPIIK